jgi:hypothetical protein
MKVGLTDENSVTGLPVRLLRLGNRPLEPLRIDRRQWVASDYSPRKTPRHKAVLKIIAPMRPLLAKCHLEASVERSSQTMKTSQQRLIGRLSWANASCKRVPVTSF